MNRKKVLKHFEATIRQNGIQEKYFTHAYSTEQAKRNIKKQYNTYHKRVPETFVNIEHIKEIAK